MFFFHEARFLHRTLKFLFSSITLVGLQGTQWAGLDLKVRFRYTVTCAPVYVFRVLLSRAPRGTTGSFGFKSARPPKFATYGPRNLLNCLSYVVPRAPVYVFRVPLSTTLVILSVLYFRMSTPYGFRNFLVQSLEICVIVRGDFA